MSNEFPGDLYRHVLEDTLGPDYFEFSVHLVALRLLMGWLVEQSCFFVVLPMPDNMFSVIVKSEMQYLVKREMGVLEGLLNEAVERDD